jgi:probable FeS assembly SUF system protein SufT
MLLMPRERVTFSRDCDGIEIPIGQPVIVKAGTSGTLTQSLGGTFTVLTDFGQQVRIAGKDADAIGKDAADLAPAPSGTAPPGGEAKPLREQVMDALRTCYDPEIPVNVVELGLVYRCEVHTLPPPLSGNSVEIVMTLTAPGCGMGDILKQDIERKVRAIPGVDDLHVHFVIDPPWDQSRMSEAARLQLGLL